MCAFIDLKKANDSLNRHILWSKLESIRINSHLQNAIRAVYDYVICSVRINGFLTDWFSVKIGLKQVCPLSSMLFNIYINDQATKIDAHGKGVKVADQTVSILLFADDIVL